MESTDEARRNHRDSQAGVMCDGAGMTGAPGRIQREETRVGKSIQEGNKDPGSGSSKLYTKATDEREGEEEGENEKEAE